jgi:hypothetical protein
MNQLQLSLKFLQSVVVALVVAVEWVLVEVPAAVLVVLF